MISVKRRVIYCLCHLDYGRGAARNVCNNFLRCYFNIARVFFRIQDVADRITGFICLRFVNEGDHVVVFVQFNGETAVLRTVAGYGNGLFRYALTNYKVRIGHRLVRCYSLTVFIHIVDYITQNLPLPMRIDSSVFCDLRIKSESLISVCRGIPAFKRVTGFCRVGRNRSSLVFLNCLCIKHCRGVISIHKCYGIGRCRPLSIEDQVISRHLVKGIRIPLASRIIKPPYKSVITINITLYLRRGPNIRSLVNVGIKLYILDSF